jgi:heterodisulfide reductase subunit C
MAEITGPVQPDAGFPAEVEQALGGPVSACFHCRKCSSGCPVTFAMDFLPHQVVRLVQMGAKEQVLGCSTIWLCASCQTCTTRCPNEVDIAGLMDVLRERAKRDGAAIAEKEIAAFHAVFLGSVEKRGRVYEAGMLAEYRLKTRESGPLLKDADLGWEMLKRGKLRLLPERVRRREEVRALFRQSGEET